MPAGFGIVEGNGSAHRVVQIRLALDQIVPGRRVRVLEIGHVNAGAAIQCVDHHFAVDRAGDLGAAVLDVARDWGHPPIGVADRLGLGREVGLPAGVEPVLDVGPAIEQSAALGPKFPFEPGDKGNCLRGQKPLVGRQHRAANNDAVRQTNGPRQIGGFGHRRYLPLCCICCRPRRAADIQNRLQALPLPNSFKSVRGCSLAQQGRRVCSGYPPKRVMMRRNIATVN